MQTSTPLPLAGIKVVEISHTVMGPTCGLILADLGAEVVKVEPPTGEPMRRARGFASGFLSFFNRNKRGLSADLKDPKDLALVKDLIQRSDVLIENFAPGAMDRVGLGYQDLKKDNPGLVYCALKGFLTGPYEHRPALDELVQFMSGLAYMTGPKGRPLRAGASVVDIMGGTFGAIGILAALHERTRTGKGQMVKSSLFESAVFLIGQHMAGEAVMGEPAPPMPVRGAAWGVYEVFNCADGEGVFIGVTSDKHWRSFCEAFGFPDLLAETVLNTNDGRVAAKNRIGERLSAVVSAKTAAEVSAMCEAAAIPFAPVAKPSEMFDDVHLNSGAGLMRTQLADGRFTKLPRLPLEFSDHQIALLRQPPKLGEHNAEIKAELEAMRAAEKSA
jgi:crotonobetainyl-CoA:carnitine CoA-transferase CaiB-like acyl-CoA transferase